MDNANLRFSDSGHARRCEYVYKFGSGTQASPLSHYAIYCAVERLQLFDFVYFGVFYVL